MPTLCCEIKQSPIPPEPVQLDNYWVSKGTNYLKGCCGNPDHPIKLPDCFILNALQNVNRARLDFNRMWPALLPCEQERFTLLMERFPGLFKPIVDAQSASDKRQLYWVQSIPVHTAGPNGGLNKPLVCNKPMVQYVTG